MKDGSRAASANKRLWHKNKAEPEARFNRRAAPTHVPGLDNAPREDNGLTLVLYTPICAERERHLRSGYVDAVKLHLPRT
jgi:hypothetical protein